MKLSLLGWVVGVIALVPLAAVTPAHADAGDFGAMPGLWRIQVRHVAHGKVGAPEVQWHCVDEGADPWTTFAAWTPAAGECTATDQQRGSTSLSWKLTCRAAPPASARVAFDSAKHYTGSVTAEGGAEVTRVEGDRYAACTSPED